MADEVVTQKAKVSGYIRQDIKDRLEREWDQSASSSMSSFLESFLDEHLGTIAVSLNDESLKALQDLADKNMRSLEQQASFLLMQLLEKN